MASNLFRINVGDIGRGLLVAVLAAVFVQLSTALNTPGFDFASFNWGELLRVALASALAYITKNFFSDSEGKLLGKI